MESFTMPANLQPGDGQKSSSRSRRHLVIALCHCPTYIMLVPWNLPALLAPLGEESR